MKKIYLIAAGLFIGFGAMSQTVTKTLTTHFEGALANPQAPQIGIYTWGPGNGYVSGNNAYGDKAIVQLFDGTYGKVGTGAGTINSVKVHVARKVNTTTTGKIKVGVWENNGGEIGAELQMVDVNLSDVDTTLAGSQTISGATGITGIYNLNVNMTGLAIPANGSFFAGVVLPTSAAAGDTLVVLTTTEAFNFAGASTHAGSINATNDLETYGSNDVTISNAIFPEITQSTLAVFDLQKDNNLSVYPNPANNELNFKIEDTEVSSVKVFGMDGKLILNQSFNSTSGTINVSSLTSGFYIYEITASNGATAKNTFVKK